nr:MAG TPA: hypothetical protein [Caudoviricetes sp.]
MPWRVASTYVHPSSAMSCPLLAGCSRCYFLRSPTTCS